jgi:NTP pyrophosphatase (non-canonical NTP hydrolase)
MDFDAYQKLAQETDQKPGQSQDALLVALLGLAGEAGALLTEYKKLMRDGSAHQGFQSQVGEELGDLLWYVANIATKCNLSLGTLAEQNLEKTRGRWLPPGEPAPLFDDGREEGEQLPRQFVYTFEYREVKGAQKIVMLDRSGNVVGDPLTDNAYADDGYRFHDVLHLAHAAVLGWSPVFRKLLGRKRRSSPKVNEVEDGGRAQVIEEAIAAAAYEYATRHARLDVARVDWDLLRMIKRLTANLEVRARTEAEWEQALLVAFRVWRDVHGRDGGTVRGDLVERTLTVIPPQR